MATKKNGTKRLSPSVERQIALALVRVIECVIAADLLEREVSQADALEEKTAKTALYDQALIDRKVALDEAKQVLTLNNYGDLESIASRVAALENQLTAAISLRDGKEISRLGAALDRAKAGKPPIVVAEKKTKPASTERKPRIAKAVKEILDAFETETFGTADGRVVTGVKADDTGKACLVQFDDNAEWIGVDPKELKSITADATKKGSNASLQTANA